MKILWIDLNSSYAHSSLALPALHAQIMTDPSIEWEIVSATINENTGMIVDEIYRHRPDILAATTWLFNHEQLMHVASRESSCFFFLFIRSAKITLFRLMSAGKRCGMCHCVYMMPQRRKPYFFRIFCITRLSWWVSTRILLQCSKHHLRQASATPFCFIPGEDPTYARIDDGHSGIFL